MTFYFGGQLQPMSPVVLGVPQAFPILVNDLAISCDRWWYIPHEAPPTAAPVAERIPISDIREIMAPVLLKRCPCPHKANGW